MIPIGRGNEIKINYKNICITIIDHSYNSSYESVLYMINAINTSSIVILTPLKLVNDSIIKCQNIVKYINNNNNIKKFIMYINDHTNKNYEQLFQDIMDFINQYNKNIYLYIKGAGMYQFYKFIIFFLKKHDK